MITGKKRLHAKPQRSTIVHKIFAAAGIGLSVSIFVYALQEQSPLRATSKQPLPYMQDEAYPLMRAECASCHTLYPPYMLSSRAWTKMMANLDSHFNTDARLLPGDRGPVKGILLRYSGDNAQLPLAKKMLHSAKAEELSIIKNPFIEKTHARLDEKKLQAEPIKSLSNCNACHVRVETTGRINALDLNTTFYKRFF